MKVMHSNSKMDETYIKSKKKKIQQLYTVKVLEYVNIKYVIYLWFAP